MMSLALFKYHLLDMKADFFCSEAAKKKGGGKEKSGGVKSRSHLANGSYVDARGGGGLKTFFLIAVLF